MSIDLTQIIVAVLGVLASLITAYVIPWLKKKISAENQQIILSVADAAVLAVEQLYKTLGGEAKKEQAVQTVTDWLGKYNISVDKAQIEAAVEAAVKKMN